MTTLGNWNKPQLETSRRINLASPFITPPKVIVFLKQLGMDKNRSWRLYTKASDTDTSGFSIRIKTWGDSIFNAGGVSILAVA